jgi:hypothetical protein
MLRQTAFIREAASARLAYIRLETRMPDGMCLETFLGLE